jgi:hypothetical protein
MISKGFKRTCTFFARWAILANNPDEQAIRAEYLRYYADKFEAIAFFSQIHSRSLLDLITSLLRK